jgi:hypothetical protein
MGFARLVEWFGRLLCQYQLHRLARRLLWHPFCFGL